MIRVKRISIRELRGIRELDLTPNGQSFVVLGPTALARAGSWTPLNLRSPATCLA